MRTAGLLRLQLANRLRAGYALGLMTHDTFVHRIDDLYDGSLIDPQRLVGDLTFRSPRGESRSWRRTLTELVRATDRHDPETEGLSVLALDWTGATPQMVVGRSLQCDLVLEHATVSRRHVQLFFREGRWILIDLESTNGTFVNERAVQRSELLPGDTVRLGLERLRVD